MNRYYTGLQIAYLLMNNFQHNISEITFSITLKSAVGPTSSRPKYVNKILD